MRCLICGSELIEDWFDHEFGIQDCSYCPNECEDAWEDEA